MKDWEVVAQKTNTTACFGSCLQCVCARRGVGKDHAKYGGTGHPELWRGQKQSHNWGWRGIKGPNDYHQIQDGGVIGKKGALHWLFSSAFFLQDRFLYISRCPGDQAGLELMNIHLPLPPSAENKGMCHYCPARAEKISRQNILKLLFCLVLFLFSDNQNVSFCIYLDFKGWGRLAKCSKVRVSAGIPWGHCTKSLE